MTDIDIWRAAKQMIDQHGADAATEAAMRADAFGAKDNRQGVSLWLRIKQAIEWLQDTRGGDPFKIEH